MTRDITEKHLHCMEVWGGNQPIDTSVVLPGLDAWVFSRPFEGAPEGGDVHYVSSCAAGVISRLLVADVSGHGAAVSETARHLRALMRRYVNHHRQTSFVRALNRQFVSLASAGTFATAIVATYEGPLGRLLLTNAGHPPPLLYHTDTNTWNFLEATPRNIGCSTSVPLSQEPLSNLPLGIEDLSDYEQFDVPLATGDLVLCYTDALPEARRGADQLSDAGILDLLRTVDVSSPALLIPRLVQAVGQAGWTIADDLTLLLFRPNGTRPYVPLTDKLLAPFRLLTAVARSVVERGTP